MPSTYFDDSRQASNTVCDDHDSIAVAPSLAATRPMGIRNSSYKYLPYSQQRPEKYVQSSGPIMSSKTVTRDELGLD